MKRVELILLIFLSVVMAGCGGNKQSVNEFITVDVNRSYPEKELILQDFMDVEYIPLETNDEFLNKEQVSLGQQPEEPVNHEIATCQILNASDLVVNIFIPTLSNVILRIEKNENTEKYNLFSTCHFTVCRV